MHEDLYLMVWQTWHDLSETWRDELEIWTGTKTIRPRVKLGVGIERIYKHQRCLRGRAWTFEACHCFHVRSCLFIFRLDLVVRKVFQGARWMCIPYGMECDEKTCAGWSIRFLRSTTPDHDWYLPKKKIISPLLLISLFNLYNFVLVLFDGFHFHFGHRGSFLSAVLSWAARSELRLRRTEHRCRRFRFS